MNRRELLKAALGVPLVQTIERIEAKPGDVFVLKLDPDVKVSSIAISRLYATWKAVFENAGLPVPPVMVLQGVDVTVIRKG